MIARLAFVVLAALFASGCVTVSNTLPVEQVATFQLAAVNVTLPPPNGIWWGDGERAYAMSKGRPAHESEELGKTEEGQAYLRSAIAAKVRDAMTRHLAGELTGSRPVRVEVVVTGVQIASAMQRILVGGGHMMSADVTLVDARTGQVLVAYPAQTTAAGAGSGLLGTMVEHAALAEPIDRVVDNYASQYSRWLVRK